jgi:Flp pilus assembly protein TadG
LNPRQKNRARKIWTSLSRRPSHREKGAELLELALVLPLLLVLVVGVIDFGQAYAIKDQLTGAARDGARVAVNGFNDTDTANPQCGGAPCSVQAAANAVIIALNNTNNPNINTCGVNTSDVASAGTFAWIYTAPCANPLTILVERAVPPPAAVDGTTALYTRVTVTYPYNWNFANVAGLLGGTNSFSNTINLNSVAIMANLN